MATRGRKPTAPQLTPGQASYVLDRLIADRRVSSGEVSRYVGEMRQEIDDLERRLNALRRAAEADGKSSAPRQQRGRRSAAPAAPRRRRRSRKTSAEQAASRKIQGRYLGLIRQIAASKRAQYQKIARDKGREAAIKEMASALGK